MRPIILSIVSASIVFGLRGVASASIQQDPTTLKYFEAVVVPRGVTWAAANSAATAAGGYLAILDSSTLNSWVYTNVVLPTSGIFSGSGANTIGPWLGGFSNTLNAWSWVSNVSFPATTSVSPYADWYSGQPDGNTGQPQGLLYYNAGTSGPSWGDVKQTGEPGFLPTGYVVEFDTNPTAPEPSAVAVWCLLGAMGIAIASRRQKAA